MDSTIQLDYGAYNRICPNCLARFSHNIIECRECHYIKTETFNNNYKNITYRNWILRAIDDKYARERIGYMLWISIKLTPEDDKIYYKIIRSKLINRVIELMEKYDK